MDENNVLGDFLGKLGDAWIGYKAKDQQYQFELEKAKVMAYGPMGYYREGQLGVYPNSGAAFGLGVSPLLLIGLAAAAIFLLKD